MSRYTFGARVEKAMTRLWRGLVHPWLLLVAATLGCMMLASLWLLPQLPGQLTEEPATAARWLRDASARYGVWGNVLASLGLFSVLSGPLLKTLLALLGLIGMVHLADQVGTLRQFLRVRKVVHQPVGTDVDAPLWIGAAHHVYRARVASDAEQPIAGERIAQMLAAPNTDVARAAVVAGEPPRYHGDGHNGEYLRAASGSQQALPEERLVAVHHRAGVYLRPLLPLGLLIAALALWTATAFGWQVGAPALAPGDSFRSANHDVAVAHVVASAESGVGYMPKVEVQVGSRSATYPADEAAQIALGGARVQVRGGDPALWIATADGAPLLTHPGSTDRKAGVGLVLPVRGSEESLLLPDFASGLRLVRRVDADAAFIVELYRSDTVQPAVRTELALGEEVTIPIDGEGIALQIISLPALEVSVDHLPGLGLAWVGVVMACVGAVGYFWRSSYVIVQAAPWPDDRTVVVVQGNRAEDVSKCIDAALGGGPLQAGKSPDDEHVEAMSA